MASSQVEIASSSPFSYVLNRNVFQKNLKNLVQSHLHSCITNSQNHADLWVHKTQYDKNENDTKKTKASEKWDKARNMVFSMDKENKDDGAVEVPNLGGVSSLVRKWKDFEAESKSPNMANNNSLVVESPQKGFDECDESCIVKGDSLGDCESDRTDSDITESERLRVADIIKKLTLSSNIGDESPGRDNNGTNVVANGGSLPRVRTSSDNAEQQQRCGFSPVLNSPRFIRGRQAFSDLLLQMERDRHRELEGLVERNAVSKFQQRGRIQALLRVRLIRRGAEVRDGRSANCPPSESIRLTNSAIMHLREKFNTVGQLDLADSRNTSKEVAERTHESGSLPSSPKRGKETCDQEFKGPTSPQRKLAYSDSAKAGSRFSSQRQEDPRQGMVKERAGLQLGVADSRSTSIALGDNTPGAWTCNEENHHHKPISFHEEVVTNYPKDGNICTSNPPKQENHHEEVSEETSPRNVATKVHAGSGILSYQQREGYRHKEVVRERAGMQPGVVDSTSTPRVKGEYTRDTFTSKEENHHKPRNPQKEVVANIIKVGNYWTSNQLREGNDYKELSEQTSPNSLNTEKEIAFSATNSKVSCRSNQNDMDWKSQEARTNLPSCTSQAQSLDNFHEQASWGKISSEASHSNLLDFVESARLPAYEGTNKQSPGTCTDWYSDCTNPQSDWEVETANQQLVETDSGWVSDYSHTASGWDELHSNYEQQVEGSEDWISNISRPRKEWECLRQERYQEMLDPFVDNHDIQQLLLRKNVSNFLTSGLREKIDRIMVSRSQQLPNTMSKHIEEVPVEVAEEEEEVASQQNARAEEVEVEEGGDSCYDDDSEDGNNTRRQLYNEPEILLVDQNTSLQTPLLWSPNQDHEVTDESYLSPSTSSLQSQSSNIYCQYIQPCSSSARHPSTEMELIYELRGHMEQLHQEIFEIRRSMKSCMNMQIKLQCSIKQDVAAAISQLGQKSLLNSDNRGSNKGNCCICYAVPVDSLLYRCGHMCTCFKCAHELLGGTGKCPICRAPILDVVRAYAHS